MAGVIKPADAVRRFLDMGSSDGRGSGSGAGSGAGDGVGAGSGEGVGSDVGSGWCSNDGWGFGSGSGWGPRWGSGSGSGAGSCSIWGSGSGSRWCSDYGESCNDIELFCGETVFVIDGTPTIIRSIHGSVASGAILRADLTLKKCYVVKGGGRFAHGDTIHAAMDALRDKLFEDMPIEKRIEAFIGEFTPGVKYSVRQFYDWHHRLTGSCEMGRTEFALTHDIDLEHDMMTPEEFISLTENAYGGNVIKQLKAAMNK